MAVLEAFLPYDVLDLRGDRVLSSEVRTRLRASLPNWVDFCVDTQEAENYTLMSVGPLANYLEQVNYTDREKADFHQMRLAATHANRLLLHQFLPHGVASIDRSPNQLLQSQSEERSDLWDKLGTTEHHLMEDLTDRTVAVIKHAASRTEEQELLIVIATRLLLLRYGDDVHRTIHAYLSDQAKTHRNELYLTAKANKAAMHQALTAPNLVAITMARLTRARLLAKDISGTWDRKAFSSDVRTAVKLQEDTSWVAGLKKALKYPKRLKGKVKNKVPRDGQWNRRTDVFELELSSVLDLLEHEDEAPGDRVVEKLIHEHQGTDPLLLAQYYKLFSQNPDFISLE